MGGETKQYKNETSATMTRTKDASYAIRVQCLLCYWTTHGSCAFFSPVTFDGQYGSVLGSRAATGLSRRFWQGSEMVPGRFGYESN